MVMQDGKKEWKVTIVVPPVMIVDKWYQKCHSIVLSQYCLVNKYTKEKKNIVNLRLKRVTMSQQIHGA
jgi:hypothetical protein